MITEWFLTTWRDIVEAVVGWTSDFEVPDFFANFDDTWNTVAEGMGVAGAWVEWTGIITILMVVLAIFGLGLGVKGLRAVAAHIPFFGGAG